MTTSPCVVEHRRFLVLHQHLAGDAHEVLECTDQDLIGLLPVLAGRGIEADVG